MNNLKKSNEKKEKGITLVSLTTTIVVLLILTSAGVYTGVSSIKSATFTKYKVGLEIMQAQVNLLSEENKKEIEDSVTKGETFTKLGKDVPENLLVEEGGINIFLLKVKNYDSTIVSTDSSSYRYIDEEQQKELGLEDTKTDFLVDFVNKQVIATKGLEYKGKTYYTLNQIKNQGEET